MNENPAILARRELATKSDAHCPEINGEHICHLVEGHTSLWHACCVSDISMTTWTDSSEEWDRFKQGAYRKE